MLSFQKVIYDYAQQIKEDQSISKIIAVRIKAGGDSHTGSIVQFRDKGDTLYVYYFKTDDVKDDGKAILEDFINSIK